MFLLLLACTGPEAKVDPVDADGDGHFSVATEGDDCDDGAAAVHPDAAEVCDGVDNNCDGAVDEDDPALDTTTATAVYLDGDSDGWGVGEPSWACTLSGTECTLDGDCDDTRADVNPDAPEVCDAEDTDEDCDGAADDADPSADATTESAYYADADGDGYGSGGAASACDPPAGSAASGGDCNDGDVAVNPAAVEVCDSRDEDEDCDGLADDADPSLDATSGAMAYPDEDSDGYGAGAGRAACEVAEGEVLVAGDCDDTNRAIHPGASEVCDDRNVDENCNTLADDDDPTTSAASMFDEYGDADGDGSAGTLVGTACDVPAGYRTAEDCNDADDTIHPGATEVCDAADTDEDCDGRADDDDASVDTTGATVWYSDADGDGYASTTGAAECDAEATDTVQGEDCNDLDADVSPADNDGDGVSGCDGDCDDTDATASATCEYTSMIGDFNVSGGNTCAFDLQGTLADGTVCPDCDFSFDTTAVQTSGGCVNSFYATLGYRSADQELTFLFYDTYELGPLDATLTSGSGYDILAFSSYSIWGYLYYGTLLLY